jgi:pSer/pThr/pTyr-binding forkhead associated (FHA) protein
MRLHLTALTPGKWHGWPIPVVCSPFRIGRDRACHLRPSNPIISQRHCTLRIRDNRAFVQDLNSENGTFVNGTRIVGEIELRNGDCLRVGPIEFQIEIEPSISVDARTPLPPTIGVDDADRLGALAADEDASAGHHEQFDEDWTDTVGFIAPAQETVQDSERATHKAKPDTSSAAEAILKKYLRRPRS